MQTERIRLTSEQRTALKALSADDKRELADKYALTYAHVQNVLLGFRNNDTILRDALELASKKTREHGA